MYGLLYVIYVLSVTSDLLLKLCVGIENEAGEEFEGINEEVIICIPLAEYIISIIEYMLEFVLVN